MNTFKPLKQLFCSIILPIIAFVVTSCPGSLDPPQKIAISAEPGIHLNIGAYVFDPNEEIKGEDILDSADMKAYGYKYSDDASKTFLLHYDMPAIEKETEIEDFNFADMGKMSSSPITINIPDVSPSSSVYLVIPMFSIPPGVEEVTIPVQNVSFLLNLNGAFESAQIGNGKLIFGDDDNFDFSGASLTLNGSVPNPPFRVTEGKKTFSLNNAFISKNSSAAVTGSIKIKTAILSLIEKNGNWEIPITVTINGLKSIRVNTAENRRGESTPDAADMKDIKAWGVESITFKEIGIKCKVEVEQNSKPLILDGLTVKIEGTAGSGNTIPVIDGDKITQRINTANGEHFFTGAYKTLSSNDMDQLQFKFNVNPAEDDIITLTAVAPNFIQANDTVTIRTKFDPVLDWERATVDITTAQDSKRLDAKDLKGLIGIFPGSSSVLDIKDMLSAVDELFEDGKIELLDADLYMYVDGDPSFIESVTMKLWAEYTNASPQEDYIMGDTSKWGEFKYRGQLPAFFKNPAGRTEYEGGDISLSAHYTDPNKRVKDIFNDRPRDLTLHYEAKVADYVTISKGQTYIAVSIKPDILIRLPLDLKLIPDNQNQSVNFTRLSLDRVFGDVPNEDLFGRTDNSRIDEWIKNTKDMSCSYKLDNKMGLEDARIVIINTVHPDADIRTITILDVNVPDNSIPISNTFLGDAFIPAVELHLPLEDNLDENGKKYSELDIKQGSLKLMDIDIRAKVELKDYEVTDF
ncbi:MAG: hypothetical protein LBP76_05810 [Treponema sp.]|jgi:hypothetical protein|nr:hypothetical protein [Treponema sp.]